MTTGRRAEQPEEHPLLAEIARRVALPEAEWIEVKDLSELTAEARARLAELRRAGNRRG